MKMKMVLMIKKANETTTMTTKTFKCHKNSTLFDAQNAAGSRFQIFLGGMPPDPLTEGGRKAPLVVTAAYLAIIEFGFRRI